MVVVAAQPFCQTRRSGWLHKEDLHEDDHFHAESRSGQ